MQHANNYRNSPENVHIQNLNEIESNPHLFSDVSLPIVQIQNLPWPDMRDI
ncbi:hypothetical protein ACINWC323_1295 [Acinetobacter sp. WC-323]|nr:hypothetical protein ACINWC323_1295 [Acinetobacter sp. WC-323]